MNRLMFSVLVCLVSVSAIASDYAVNRLEPGNWWVGMKHNSLQLMVYGENISELEPALKYPGVKISKVERVANPDYLFVTLTIGNNAKAGNFPLRFKLNNEVKTSFTYQLYPRAQASAQRQGFSARDAIYLITPDRFANGDPGNDNVVGLLEQPRRDFAGGRHGGDIAGIKKHLDYIADMGFTQIWSNPLLENNQPDYSYHGYAITDLYKIDARFGTNEDYRDFVAAAKAKNIGVIKDVILNHVGSGHWWMKSLPTEDWLNSAHEYAETNHARTTIHDSYASDFDRKVFTDGWFVKTMPDLNQRNPFLAQYLIQNTLWWIEYAGLSGLRADTYSYPDKEFLSEWSRRVMEEYPHFSIVGEEWSGNPAVVAYWQRGKKNHDGYVSYTPSMMDFPLREALLEGLQESTGWHGGLHKTYEMLANDFQYSDPDNLVIFEGNHDTARIFSLLDDDYGLYQAAMVYIATMRGIPQFFYGTEILMTSPKERADGEVRSDFPGGWEGDRVNAFTGAGLSTQQKEAQDWLKKLLNWRKSSAVVHSGKLMHFVPQNGVYVYFRYNDSKKIMVVLTNNTEATELKLDRYAEMIGGAARAQDVLSEKIYTLAGTLTVPAKAALIFELR